MTRRPSTNLPLAQVGIALFSPKEPHGCLIFYILRAIHFYILRAIHDSGHHAPDTNRVARTNVLGNFLKVGLRWVEFPVPRAGNRTDAHAPFRRTLCRSRARRRDRRFPAQDSGGRRQFRLLWLQALGRIFAEEHPNEFIYESGVIVGSHDHACFEAQ